MKETYTYEIYLETTSSVKFDCWIPLPDSYLIGRNIKNLLSVGLIRVNNSMADHVKTEVTVPENKTEMPQCTLTNAELLEKCREWITKLCDTGGRAWVMHVPARLNNDPDLLFAELTWRFKKLLRAGSGNTKNDVTVTHIINDKKLLDTIAEKLMLHADEKILSLLELPAADVFYTLNKIKSFHNSPDGNFIPDLEDAVLFGYNLKELRKMFKTLKRNTKNDDTSANCPECGSNKTKPYDYIPSECIDCGHKWLE